MEAFKKDMYEYFEHVILYDWVHNNEKLKIETLLLLFENEELLSRTLIDKGLYTTEYVRHWQREMLYERVIFDKLWDAVELT